MIRAIEDSLTPGLLKDKIVLADTSFVAKLFRPERYSEPVRAFYEFHSNDGAIFCINVTVRQELLKLIRKFLIIEALESLKTSPEIRCLYDLSKRRDDLGKQLIAAGHLPFVQKALGGRIKRELDNATAPFLSERDDPKKPLSWDDTCAIMEAYGMDSSDAMILNFAVGRKYDALVTADKDYAQVKTTDDFDIFVRKQHVPH